MADAELLKLSISELAPRIKAREVSPVEVTEAALAQAERLQPKLNSFIKLLPDEAMAAAREQEAALARGEYKGPLHGIPIGIKDNIATAGIPTSSGSRILENFIPDEDAQALTLCKNAGAIVLGKENLSEFAAEATSNNRYFGAVHNPWNIDYVPGGSSGGGGANVAASVTFASLGSDIGGSVRLPGAFCGVVGLKQTFGRVSQRGLQVTHFNGDHISPLTRTVRDNALLLQTIAGYDPLDPTTVPVPVSDYTASLGRDLKGLKLGIPKEHFFDLIEPQVDAAFRQAVSAPEGLGVEAREVSIPMLEYSGAYGVAAMTDNFVSHEPHIKAGRGDYEPVILQGYLTTQFFLARDYAKALRVLRLIQQDYARILQEVDFLVTPTTPMSALRIDSTTINLGGEEHPGGRAGARLISRNTGLFNPSGLPVISVPCGFGSEGLPIGLQIICRPFEEELMFSIAHAYEGVSPSKGQIPGIVDAG